MNLSIRYEPATVLLSIAVAIFASYAALELAWRVRAATDRIAATLWLVIGALTMGSGIWSMHFIGMAAAELPFLTRYETSGTFASWLAAVLVSAAALAIAARVQFRWPMFAALSVLLGGGGTVMHYIGMSALKLFPAMNYDPYWVLASVAVSIAGTAFAFSMFFWLPGETGGQRIWRQLAVAAALGGSLSAMHYMAMMAAGIAIGSVCLTSNGFDVNGLDHLVALASIVLLTLMVLLTAIERRTQLQARRLRGSLDKARDELAYVTFTDVTTGLPNRLVFQDRLTQAVARCDRAGWSIAVLFIDLDGTNLPGSFLTEASGAKLLREVGGRLRATVRASDTVASAGRGQFLVLLDELESAEPASRVAEQIIHALGPAFPLGELPVHLHAWIGIALVPGSGAFPHLVSNARTAMLSARELGGQRFAFFEPQLDAEARERMQWLHELRLAIENRELELHYQPKIYARSGEFAGVEALLRWRHPVRGMVSPALFIPLAEQFGLIHGIGSWVIVEACRQMRQWADENRLPMRVAVNLSAHQLRQPQLADEIIGTLQRFRIEPARLTCELTESAAMSDITVTGTFINRLQAAGICMSIDDFGTGYSSLSYLRRLPVRQLKIDRSFINDLADSADARAIAQGIIDLAHALRLEVVAEGVETGIQREILLELGCDKLQGYLFARPMNAAQVAVWAVDNGLRQLRERVDVDMVS